MPHIENQTFEHLRRYKPPYFDRMHDPTMTKDWFKRLQPIFGYMRLEDHKKVACGINQLDKETLCWWEVMAQAENAHVVTWDLFTILFREKYVGEADLTGRVKEFMELK